MRTFKFNSDNLDEIVFEHRNKEYGAYELRKSYSSRLIKSLFTSLFFISLVIALPVLVCRLLKKETPVVFCGYDDPVTPKPVIFVEQTKIITPTSNTLKPPKQNVIADAYVVKHDSLIHNNQMKNETIQTNERSTSDGNESNVSSTNNSNDTVTGEENSTGRETILMASSEPYNLALVDKIPQFKGGESALIRFLENNIHFNESARLSGISGRVYASFIINSKGEIESIKIIHGIGYGLDEEVVRVLNLMPKWEPAYYHGVAVSSILNIPVAFNIVQ